jgi:hypothetical protein
LVLGLLRCERLPGALRQFGANRSSEVKAIVREVRCGVAGSLHAEAHAGCAVAHESRINYGQ